MAKKAENSSGNLTIAPSQVGPLMRSIWRSGRVPFLWGPPGIGKSDVLKQQANAMNIAYIDVRLATRNPTQIGGVPFPEEVHGETTVRYSIPSEFPRDLDVDTSVDIVGRKKLRFSSLNPTGANGIHYCQNPEIIVSALDPDHIATIVEQSNDHFIVELADKNTGAFVRGTVLYTITGTCRAMMCFDELSSAKTDVQAVAYSLINDRRLGEYVFPLGVWLVAAGNREEDRGATYALTQPLRNRFTHYTLKVSGPDWIGYAKLVGAYPAILRFHEETEAKCLFDFDPESKSMAWSSPRSWMILSDIEYSLDRDGVTDSDIRLAAIAGTIGDKHALTYKEYKERHSTLPTPVDILAGRAILDKPLDASEQMFVSTLIIWALRTRLKTLLAKGTTADRAKLLTSEAGDEFYNQANNAMTFMMKAFRPDLLAGVVRNMSRTYKLPLDPRRMPQFAEYLNGENAVPV